MTYRRVFIVLTFLSSPAIGLAQIEDLTAEAIAQKYGCIDCHRRDSHKTGPSFQSIAHKANVDVSGFDLAFVSVNSVADIPEKRRSTVIVAQVGKELHIRIFDDAGQRVVDKAEASLLKDSKLDGLKRRWNGNLLPDGRRLEEADRKKLSARLQQLPVTRRPGSVKDYFRS